MPSHNKVIDGKVSKKRYKLYLRPDFDEFSVSNRTLSRLRKLEKESLPSVNPNTSSEQRLDENFAFEAYLEEQSETKSDNKKRTDESNFDIAVDQIQQSFVNNLHNKAGNKTVRNEYTSLYEEVLKYKTKNGKSLNDEVDENHSCSSDEDNEKSLHSICSTTSSSDDEESTDGSGVEGIDDQSKEGTTGYYYNTTSMQGYLMMFAEAQLLVSDVLLMCETFSMKKGLSRRDQDDLIELVKTLAGPRFKDWNATHYFRSKCYDPPSDKISLHFFCTKCNTTMAIRHLHKTRKYESLICNQCHNDHSLSITNSNYFIMVDLEFQLQLLLNQPALQISLLRNLENIRSTSDSEIIADIHNSELYKNLQSCIPNILTFNFNVDGASMFNSSRQSFWNILLCINELPPKLRFKSLLLAGVFVTDTEPKYEFMKLYLEAFCKQVETLREEGVLITNCATGDEIKLHFDILTGCVDSVARPIIQARIAFSGYWGCSWCYVRGEFINGAVRYILSEEDPEMRTNERYINEAADAEKLNKIVSKKKKYVRSVLGVKGASAFIESAPYFDNIWGFPVELLHGPELGIGRQQWTVWTSTTTEHHLKPLQCKEINKRLKAITPPHEVSRSPKPITECAQWKASQWSDWILYWSIPCLDGILHSEYLECWALFVKSLYKLSSDHITTQDLRECDYNLLKFVGQFQVYYGEGAITFNIHSALHFVTSVQKTGPQWATSAYPFEGGIFHYKKLINGPKQPAHQIAKKFLQTMMLSSNIDTATDSTVCQQYCRGLFEPQRLKQCTKVVDGVVFLGAGSSNVDIVGKVKKYLTEEVKQILVFNRCVFNNILLHGSTYTRASKTDDSVVLMKSGEIVNIHYLIMVNEIGYLYGSIMKTTLATFSGTIQLSYIEELIDYGRPKIIGKISDIKKKIIRITTNERTFVINPANTGEHH